MSEGTPTPRGARDPKREQLIVEHLGLARHLASRFVSRGESREDLEQAAYLALVKAADRFDESRGIAFAHYASHVVLGELKHHFRDTGWVVRAPRQLQELYLEVSKSAGELTQRLGRSPTVPELAQACGRREDEVLAAIEAGRGYRTASLEAPGVATISEGRLASMVTDELHDRDELSSFLAKLPPDDRALLEMRFVEELSQSEIATRLGVSQMQVSRLLRRALDALRRQYREAARS